VQLLCKGCEVEGGSMAVLVVLSAVFGSMHMTSEKVEMGN
jgi:hypothetical protein